MKALVTGATGFIGYHVAKLLRDKDVHVRALVRSETDAAFLEDIGVELILGDITDINTIYSALRGCSRVYHLAADCRQWVRDPQSMYDVNVHGTRNVLYASLMMSIEKVVYTSTVEVLGADRNGAPVNEDASSDIVEMAGPCEASKLIAEREVAGFLRKGLPVVVVNPSTSIGPMDRRPGPGGRIILDFLRNPVQAYVDTTMNFVGVDDVAEGHVLAAEKGRPGQRYILGNRNMTLTEFYDVLASVTGKNRVRMPMPYLPMMLAAQVDSVISKWVTGRPPRMPVGAVKTARQCRGFDCSKAVTELQMPQRAIENAVGKAVEWYERNGYVKRYAKSA